MIEINIKYEYGKVLFFIKQNLEIFQFFLFLLSIRF